MRTLLTLAALLALTSSADAGPLGIVTPRGEPGPVRQLIQGRRGHNPSCTTCAAPSFTPAPSYAAPVVVASHSAPATCSGPSCALPSYAPSYLPGYAMPATSSCPNGRCPLPVR